MTFEAYGEIFITIVLPFVIGFAFGKLDNRK